MPSRDVKLDLFLDFSTFRAQLMMRTLSPLRFAAVTALACALLSWRYFLSRGLNRAGETLLVTNEVFIHQTFLVRGLRYRKIAFVRFCDLAMEYLNIKSLVPSDTTTCCGSLFFLSRRLICSSPQVVVLPPQQTTVGNQPRFRSAWFSCLYW